MGKVKDETASAKAKSAKSAGKGGGGKRPSRFAPFLANLTRTDAYKPLQGKYARLWTVLGLGLLILVGVYRLYQTQLEGQTSQAVQFGVPAVLVAALGWLLFRIMNYPPFVDFLIATEAEMNKVSWTTKAELKRATIVVIATVLLMAIYLYVVDQIWVYLLQLFHILRVVSPDFGSQAG